MSKRNSLIGSCVQSFGDSKSWNQARMDAVRGRYANLLYSVNSCPAPYEWALLAQACSLLSPQRCYLEDGDERIARIEHVSARSMADAGDYANCLEERDKPRALAEAAAEVAAEAAQAKKEGRKPRKTLSTAGHVQIHVDAGPEPDDAAAVADTLDLRSGLGLLAMASAGHTHAAAPQLKRRPRRARQSRLRRFDPAAGY